MTSRNVVIGPLTFEYQVVRHEAVNNRIRIRYRRPNDVWKWVPLSDLYPGLRTAYSTVFEATSVVAAERAMNVHIQLQRDRDADLSQDAWIPLEAAPSARVN